MMDETTAKAVVDGSSSLIQTFSGIIGDYFRPIAKVKGEIKAEEIKAKHEANKEKLRQEAQNSFESRAELSHILQIEQEQQNLETVVGIALPMMQGEGTPPNDSWNNAFKAGAKEAYDVDIQTLWANILKEEYAKPGTIGTRSLKVIKDLTKEDAVVFNKFISIADIAGGFIPAIPGVGDPLKFTNIPFPELTQMVDIGLISTVREMTITSNIGTLGNVSVHTVVLKYTTVSIIFYSTNEFNIPMIKLTKTGLDLARTLQSQIDLDLIKSVLVYHKSNNISIGILRPDNVVDPLDMTIEQINSLNL